MDSAISLALPRQSESSTEIKPYLCGTRVMTTTVGDEVGIVMAPVVGRTESPGLKSNEQRDKAKAHPSRKKPWRRDPRLLRGSVREGQGFAFWRKQKIQRDYKKLLKKEGSANSRNNIGYTEDYPDHLKHLYLAEEEMLKKQSRVSRSRNKGSVPQEEQDTEALKYNRIQQKPKAKSSNQKAKEDYERIKAEKEKKKEAARQRREEREKAQKLYKQKKMEMYKMLSKRTRKGQPNLNVQMEYLLQKIQQSP